ncbi:hypothetical protein AAFF_G00301800 [Aldrovandia affinis]|uniref:Secreted protein n=1 Tax=Aldrovandia affinis TaxID=143900 RepID=A0AAD7SQ57_9TELE|nr:hypothetical protein AAFF_G00301800 [Aldrovandia affinis]
MPYSLLFTLLLLISVFLRRALGGKAAVVCRSSVEEQGAQWQAEPGSEAGGGGQEMEPGSSAGQKGNVPHAVNLGYTLEPAALPTPQRPVARKNGKREANRHGVKALKILPLRDPHRRDGR